MRIDGDTDSIGSIFGTLCSLILFVITAGFAGIKLKVLETRSDVNILSATKDLYFTDDDVFSYSDGLNLAVAFTSFSDM